MRCRNSSMFHPLRLEWCPNFDTNPCQSLALKDVNLCVKYVARLWREVGCQCLYGSADFPSRMKPLVSIFGQKCSKLPRWRFHPDDECIDGSDEWLKDWALLVPSYFLHIFHCVGLRSMFPMSKAGRNSHGKLGIRVDQCSKMMFNVFSRVLVSTCQH